MTCTVVLAVARSTNGERKFLRVILSCKFVFNFLQESCVFIIFLSCLKLLNFFYTFNFPDPDPDHFKTCITFKPTLRSLQKPKLPLRPRFSAKGLSL